MSVCEELKWGVHSLGPIQKSFTVRLSKQPEGKMCTFVSEHE